MNTQGYAILGATYDVAMYEHTVQELEDKGYITWETRLIRLKPGDVVYIYYSRLPLEQDGRILFRTEVLESNLRLTRDEIYGNHDMSVVKAVKLAKVTAVAYADVDKFSMYALRDEYDIATTRGGLYLEPGKEAHQRLVRKIEDNPSDWSDIRETLAFFGNKIKAYNDKTFCACGKNHVTFIKPDGTKYFEGHHLVPHSVIRRLGLVDWEENIVQLCSNCHNEIHYGHIDSRRGLISKLYSAKKSWYDQEFGAYTGQMSVLDWLYKEYGVEKSQ